MILDFFKKYLVKLIEKQNGGDYNKVLAANELFTAGSHKISGVQFSAFPATITVAKIKDSNNVIVDCIPLQAASGETEIVVNDGTYVFGHSSGYVSFQCDVACTVNLISNN